MSCFVRSITLALLMALPVSAFSYEGMSQNAAKKAEGKMPAMADMATTPSPSENHQEGKVLETMDGGGYTYIYLEKKSGQKVWVAVPQMKVRVGDEMQFSQGNEMGKFTSRALKRTFDSIIFASDAVNKTLKDSETIKKAHEGVSSGMGTPEVGSEPEMNIRVEKATGANAYTVAELHDKSSTLNEKNIVFKAKVMKFSSGIMGKNWVHLSDGSGDAAKGTQKIIATSDDTAKVGDVVTVSGTLYKDKDFGSGYKYAVIIENATIKP